MVKASAAADRERPKVDAGPLMVFTLAGRLIFSKISVIQLI